MLRRTLWIRPVLQPDRSEAICRLCGVASWSLALVTAMFSPLLEVKPQGGNQPDVKAKSQMQLL